MFAPCKESLRQQHHQRPYENMFFLFLSKLPEAFRRASTKGSPDIASPRFDCVEEGGQYGTSSLQHSVGGWRQCWAEIITDHVIQCALLLYSLTDIHFWMLLENRNVF